MYIDYGTIDLANIFGFWMTGTLFHTGAIGVSNNYTINLIYLINLTSQNVMAIMC